MRTPNLFSIAAIAALSSLCAVPAFSWSISGVVKSNADTPLPDVKISSFNVPSVDANTDKDGIFNI